MRERHVIHGKYFINRDGRGWWLVWESSFVNVNAPLLLSSARSLNELLQFDHYVAVGANSGGDQVRAWLTAHGKSVLAFTDLSENSHGTCRNGLNVLSPSECTRLSDSIAFVIGTVRQKEAADLLIGHFGVDPARVFPFVNPMFAAHYRAGIQQRMTPHHERIRARLSDAQSRAYFDRVTAFYRTLDSRHLTAQPKRIGQYGYDAPGANPSADAMIVDVGAFTGDTFPDFLTATGGKCRIYALEAFPPNFQRLGDRIAQDGLQDVAFPMLVAASAKKGTIHMLGDEAIADGCARIDTAGGQTYSVPCDTLDSLFFEKGIAVDYLKMDIEGAEMEALAGGRDMLRRSRPVVAVAAYHKPEHLAEIADFLSENLAPCRLYAAHDPAWVFHIHYIAVPHERTIWDRQSSLTIPGYLASKIEGEKARCR